MFKVGEKIVCVKPDVDGDLVKDKIYTVIAVRFLTGGIKLKEATCTGYYSGYFKKDRFKKIDDNWVEKLLCELFEEVLTQ